VGDEVSLADLGAGPEDDELLGPLTPLLVGQADHHGLEHRPVRVDGLQLTRRSPWTIAVLSGTTSAERSRKASGVSG
jgi:hypothetical protein